MRLFSIIWKTLAVIVALLFGLFFSNQVGWSGAEVIVNGSEMGAGEALVTIVIFLVSAAIFGGCILAIRRLAKHALWFAIPVFLYAALVLGVWNGYLSDFDATRAYLIKNGVNANAYALEHMGTRARNLTCAEGRIEASDDTKAICARSTGSVGH